MATPRAGSGRAPRELRCQHPPCAALILPHPLPDWWESELQTLCAKLNTRLPDAVLRAFRSCHEQRDVVSFIVLLSELLVGSSSSAGGFTWPYCETCAEKLQLRLSADADDAGMRQDRAETCVRALGGGAAAAGEEGGAACASLHALLDGEEAALLGALAAAEARRTRAVRARAALSARRARLASQHAVLWAVHREVSRRLWAGREAMGALCARAERLRVCLSRLRCLRVRSDAFFIWHAEPYATINGARLGRATGRAPEWSEINASLGQLALLLNLTANSFKGGGGRPRFKFKRWRIVPFGSFTEIVPEDAPSERYPLFFDSAAWSLVGASPASKLGSALQKLMQCLGELGAYVQGLDPAFKLPYEVSPAGDKVGGLPVAPINTEPWTRALRHAATNVKWLVAFSLKQA